MVKHEFHGAHLNISNSYYGYDNNSDSTYAYTNIVSSNCSDDDRSASDARYQGISGAHSGHVSSSESDAQHLFDYLVIFHARTRLSSP